MNPENSLDELLDNSGVKLVSFPINPVVKNAADFGGAEAAAFVFNVGATALASTFTSNPNALSFIGPVVEKAGFFGWEGVKALHKKSKRIDKKVWEQFVGGVKGGLRNLITDVAIHDPLYIIMMQYGIRSSDIPAAVISAVSFLAALPIAAVAQHYSGELAYQTLKQTSKLKGFKWEKYYESRFFLGSQANPQEIFQNISARFGLSNAITSEYRDVYHNNSFPCLSGRTPITRSREIKEREGYFRNLEIVFTLTKRRTPSRSSEFNYFLIAKEKARVDCEKISFPFNRLIDTSNAEREIRFIREVKYGKELRVALDQVEHPRKPFNVIELKVYKDLDMLCDAMRYLMRKYDVRVTTQPKMEFVNNLIHI